MIPAELRTFQRFYACPSIEKSKVAIPRTRAKYERESNSKAKCAKWANFEVIQDLMSVLVIKFDQDPIKNKVATPGVTCFPL